MFWSTSYLASVSLHNLTENENMFCSIKINFHIRLFWSGNFSVISMSLWKINLEEIISFLYNHTCAVYCRLLIFPGKELIILMAFMLSLSRFILKGQSIEVFFFSFETAAIVHRMGCYWYLCQAPSISSQLLAAASFTIVTASTVSKLSTTM